MMSMIYPLHQMNQCRTGCERGETAPLHVTIRYDVSTLVIVTAQEDQVFTSQLAVKKSRRTLMNWYTAMDDCRSR